MLVYPNAKINIGLQIIEKRSDGFHNLETLFVPCFELYDILEIVPSDKFTITLYGVEYDGAPEDNICTKAYNLMRAKHNIQPVEIHLYKNIPVGAGLGGGSSDAASTLMVLNELFSLNLSRDTLAQYGSTLGSDVPFFIYNRAMLGEGRGEILSSYDLDILDRIKMKVIKPEVSISTAEAYAGVLPIKPETSLRELLKAPIEQWKETICNDFEKTIFPRYPQLAELKEQLYRDGAIYASMSGSGSAIFALYI